ncbi:L,D-transpeptidase family protein [Thermodesulfitimonas sp.]
MGDLWHPRDKQTVHYRGFYESAGCIRMFNEDVEALYPLVQPGTPVIVVGSILRGPRVLREGDCGSDVMEVQRRLRRHGYYCSQVDGNFGREMRKAVVHFRKTHRLPPDDCVDDPVYRLLGL